MIGALVPVLAPADRAIFSAVRALGDGPDVVFEVLDPHTRNYRALMLVALIAALLLQGPWRMLGTAASIIVAGVVGYALVEAVGVVVSRPRPEEVLDDVLLPAGTSWRLHPSYPSGHVVVTAAIVSAAAACVPLLRWPLWAYVAVVVWSRVAFGAHFPLDAVVGVPLGAAAGLFGVRLVASAGLLPAPSDPAPPPSFTP